MLGQQTRTCHAALSTRKEPERKTVQANEDHSLAHCSSSQQCQQVGAGWLAQPRSPDREPLPRDNSRNTAWCWQDRSRMAPRLPSHTALRTLPRHSHSFTEALDGLFLSPLFPPLQLEKSPFLIPHCCILVLHSMPLFQKLILCAGCFVCIYVRAPHLCRAQGRMERPSYILGLKL